MRRAIIWGASYWGFFAALDYCLSDSLPGVLQPSQYVPDSFYWNAGLLALAIMIAGGAMLGAAAGLLWTAVARDHVEARLAAGAALSLIAVFTAVGLFDTSPSRSTLPVKLAIPLVLAAVVIRASLNQDRARQLWYLTNPVTLSLCLIVRPWLYRDIIGESALRWQLIVGVAAALAAIVGLSRLCVRIAVKGSTAPSLRWLSYATGLVGLAAIAGGFGIRSRMSLITAADASQTAGKPNIILISMDTVRADHLSVYGYERDTTPNLRRFASESTVYSRAISAANWTAPSHASIFTGMYALRHGVRYDLPNNRLGRLPEGVPTLAETLARQGYRTAGLAANHVYLTESIGFGRGFGFYKLAMPWIAFEANWYPSVLRWVRQRLLPAADRNNTYLKAETMTAEAFRVLDQMAGRQPFFLFLNYMDAHWPYAPPEPFRSRFATLGQNPSRDEYYVWQAAVSRGERKVSGLEREDLISAYDGGIAYLDDQLGVLFDALRRAGIYDGALIIVTSDHGEAFGLKSLLEHGRFVYQNEVHVPLLIKYPGQRAPARVSTLASGVDIYPTVMEAIGAPVGRYLAGVPLQRASGEVARAVFAESYPSWYLWTNFPRFHRTARAVVRDSWKLILSSDGMRELYDLAADAGENNNLIAKEPHVAAEMEQVLSNWQKNLAPVNSPSRLDEDTLNRLKPLGYLQ